MASSVNFQRWQIVPSIPSGYATQKVVTSPQGWSEHGFRVIANPLAMVLNSAGAPLLANGTNELPIDAGFYPVNVEVTSKKGTTNILVFDDGWVAFPNQGVRISPSQPTYTGQFYAASFAIEQADTPIYMASPKSPVNLATRKGEVGNSNWRQYLVEVSNTATRIDQPSNTIVTPISNRRFVTLYCDPGNSQAIAFGANSGVLFENKTSFPNPSGPPIPPGGTFNQIPLDNNAELWAITGPLGGQFVYVTEYGS